MTAVETATLLGSSADDAGGEATAPRDPTVAVFLEGTYVEQVAYRAEHFLSTRTEILVTFPMMVFLFLLGVRLYRAGAFDGDETGRRLRGRMLAWGLGLGIPFSLLAAYVPLGQMSRYVFSIVLMLGYVGLVGWLLDRATAIGPVTVSLRAVGRTALTCYVLQNVLASWIFYAWGFGLATRADGHPWQLVVWVAVSLLSVVGARVWLSRFQRGPLEAFGAAAVSLLAERRRSSAT